MAVAANAAWRCLRGAGQFRIEKCPTPRLRADPHVGIILDDAACPVVKKLIRIHCPWTMRSQSVMHPLAETPVLLLANDQGVHGEGTHRVVIPLSRHAAAELPAASVASGIGAGNTEFVQMLCNPLEAPTRLEPLEHPHPDSNLRLVVGKEPHMAASLLHLATLRQFLNRGTSRIDEKPSEAIRRPAAGAVLPRGWNQGRGSGSGPLLSPPHREAAAGEAAEGRGVGGGLRHGDHARARSLVIRPHVEQVRGKHFCGVKDIDHHIIVVVALAPGCCKACIELSAGEEVGGVEDVDAVVEIAVSGSREGKTY